jgi:hypothetical protein
MRYEALGVLAGLNAGNCAQHWIEIEIVDLFRQL